MEQEEEENICDGVIYADPGRRSLGVDPRGLSPAFGIDHSTEQPQP